MSMGIPPPSVVPFPPTILSMGAMVPVDAAAAAAAAAAVVVPVKPGDRDGDGSGRVSQGDGSRCNDRDCTSVNKEECLVIRRHDKGRGSMGARRGS